MIRSCNINDPTPYAVGWLQEYLDVMGRNVAPWSFHLLSAFLALSSVVGRRAALVRSAGTLWPPTSILLLGQSGVGKSLALDAAYDLIHLAMQNEESFYQAHGGFTCAGVREEWRRMQQRQNLDKLEGVHVEDEVSGLLTERTGNETIATWIIRCLKHRDLQETLRDGRIEIRNMTIAFGFGSTINYLRKSVSIQDFAGGFMHRFLIAHDDYQRDADEIVPTLPERRFLADRLRAIRAAAPPELDVQCDGRLRLLHNQARQRAFDSIHLSGFWNRYAQIVLKIAGLYAIAKETWTVTDTEVDMAIALIDTRLYPVLIDVVDQVGASPSQKEQFDVADSLVRAGKKGWEIAKLFRKLNLGGQRQNRDALQSMVEQELVFQKGQRVYGRKEWAQ